MTIFSHILSSFCQIFHVFIIIDLTMILPYLIRIPFIYHWQWHCCLLSINDILSRLFEFISQIEIMLWLMVIYFCLYGLMITIVGCGLLVSVEVITTCSCRCNVFFTVFSSRSSLKCIIPSV